MSELYLGTRPALNLDLLDAELKAALPGQIDGLKRNDKNGDLWVIVTEDADADALKPQALAVLQAHDPNVLTPAQETAARRIAAQGEVSNADFLAVLNAINDATTLAAAKPIMRQLLRLVYRVALAAWLTDAPDPES